MQNNKHFKFSTIAQATNKQANKYYFLIKKLFAEINNIIIFIFLVRTNK